MHHQDISNHDIDARQNLVFHNEGFHQPVLFQLWEMLDNKNIIFRFPKEMVTYTTTITELFH